MPLQPTEVVKVKIGESDAQAPIFMINHRIAIYPEESHRLLDSFMNASPPAVPRTASADSQMRQAGFIWGIKRITSPHAQPPTVNAAPATDIKDGKIVAAKTAIGSLSGGRR